MCNISDSFFFCMLYYVTKKLSFDRDYVVDRTLSVIVCLVTVLQVCYTLLLFCCYGSFADQLILI